jgi:hypothetical protein
MSPGGTCSHRPSGGNLDGQDRPRDLIGDGQPADGPAGGQRDPLDGVDLPDLVGMDGRGDDRGAGAAAPRPVDPGADEGALETPDRRDVAPGRLSAELESDQAGAPGGMVALQVASDPEQLLGPGVDRTTAGSIVRGEALAVVSAGSPPDVSDRAIGDRQIGGDPG